MIGPLAVGAAPSVVGAGLFARVVDTAFGRAGRVAAVWFAAASVANLAVGRIAYAVGVAFGLAAVLAIQRNRPIAALTAAAACSLSSPLAGALVAAARGHRVVRIGAVLYATFALAAFAVPNPVGGNVSRLAQYVVGPLLVALGPGRRALGALLVGLLVWCQWLPAVDTFAFARTDPSARAGYYTDVVAYLSTQPGPPGRVELPFTARHWESAYAARDLVLARGWERQLDTELHPIFYGDDLDATTYRRWLTDNGVAYVALPDAPLDKSARAAGTAVLRVRASGRWALDGPGCAAATADGWTVLRNLRPGRVVLRPALRASRCPG